MAGWGITEINKPYSDTLQEVKLKLMDPQACRHFKMFDHNLQLCVGNPRKTNSASRGSSPQITVQDPDVPWKKMGSENYQSMPRCKVIGLRKLE